MRIIHSLRDFVALESAGGILLALAAAAALAIANSPLAFLYAAFLDTAFEVRVASFQIAKPLLLWINDGLMAVFFFLVGLEIKREVHEGELSDRRQIVSTAIAAICDMCCRHGLASCAVRSPQPFSAMPCCARACRKSCQLGELRLSNRQSRAFA
jgi:Na+/H+ antiporter NhaA